MNDEMRHASGNETQRGNVILELFVDESQKGKIKLNLPLSYTVEFSEGEVGNGYFPVRSVELCGNETVIKTPGSPAKWKLKVVDSGSLKDMSGTDPKGVPVTLDDDGNGDSFGPSDFLNVRSSTLQNAIRSIVLEQEDVLKEREFGAEGR